MENKIQVGQYIEITFAHHISLYKIIKCDSLNYILQYKTYQGRLINYSIDLTDPILNKISQIYSMEESLAMDIMQS